jgi:hypothetical protein
VHFAIDHVELELEELTKQAQVEDFTNLELYQGKPRCIKAPSLSFVYLYILIMLLACALSCRS